MFYDLLKILQEKLINNLAESILKCWYESINTTKAQSPSRNLENYSDSSQHSFTPLVLIADGLNKSKSLAKDANIHLKTKNTTIQLSPILKKKKTNNGKIIQTLIDENLDEMNDNSNIKTPNIKNVLKKMSSTACELPSTNQTNVIASSTDKKKKKTIGSNSQKPSSSMICLI